MVTKFSFNDSENGKKEKVEFTQMFIKYNKFIYNNFFDNQKMQSNNVELLNTNLYGNCNDMELNLES